MDQTKTISVIPDELKENILRLYPEFRNLNGPYVSKNDGRSRVTLSDGIKKTTRQLGKVVLEVKINRRLESHETADHKNNDKTNDHPDNLQILSRKENAIKGSLGNKNCLGFKQSEEQKRTGEKNGRAILKNSDVKNFRESFNKKEFSRKDIIENSGLKDKSVRNMLAGISYTLAGGPLASPAKVGRPPKK